MVLKTAFAEIVDGRVILPAEALAVLPSGARLFVLVDSEKATVTIHARDPMNPPNQEFLQSLAELNEGLTLDEYTKPVPESELHRRKPIDGGSKQ
ncbi:hypothetical protein OOT46_19880 [Aquabacterium sp. A7-Y]|uniref:hypothetical protein n=1 Tax=Aquabacterium sp. A7-Y TaxID=1349605 RepID=UPI00223D1B4B|nr:hypothetical protein [Aquabacterium sp. A7-Y]MCW7540098.1 hypothetical protein [Aquabacterium sp. A7-Y]